MYPEDFEIFVEDLVQIWITKGLIKRDQYFLERAIL